VVEIFSFSIPIFDDKEISYIGDLRKSCFTVCSVHNSEYKKNSACPKSLKAFSTCSGQTFISRKSTLYRIMKRHDQGHLHPKLEVPGLACPGWESNTGLHVHSGRQAL
jgi:hypothetical protein